MVKNALVGAGWSNERRGGGRAEVLNLWVSTPSQGDLRPLERSNITLPFITVAELQE